MKKILLIILSIVTLLSTSSCFNKVTTYKDLSEKEVSKLVRRHITQDMTHEEIFAKLESLGFEQYVDVGTTPNTKPVDTADPDKIIDVWRYVGYKMGDVVVKVTLDMTFNATMKDIMLNGGIKSYKSEFITITGVLNVSVYWTNSGGHYPRPEYVPERVTKQRKLYSKVEANIKVGDDYDAAIKTAEKMGFTLPSESVTGSYVKDKYFLYLTTSKSTNEVTSVSLAYSDIIFRNEQN